MTAGNSLISPFDIIARRPKKHMTAPFPSRDEILDFIRQSPGRVGRREIARAFGLDPSQRMALKRVMRDLKAAGAFRRDGDGNGGDGSLPGVAVVEVIGTDEDGEPLARPLDLDEGAQAPVIRMVAERRGQSALGPGDRVLARLTRLGDGVYEASTIRRIRAAPRRVLGVYEVVGGQGRLRPTDRRERNEMVVERADSKGAEPGDLISAEVLHGSRLGLGRARVVERLHGDTGPASLSLIALHDHDIPMKFTDAALEQAAAAGPAPAEGRDDLRGVPLVTIDGADARDFDDAVWAEPDPGNPGGWHLLVAIADVAWYVRPGDALDRPAYERGNSVYLPDRVLPMLPEALSNGWCSLRPHEERPCLAVDLWIDAGGRLLRHRFRRGLMKSTARLTYEQVQAAHDGNPDDATAPLVDAVIAPLYGAYRALAANRAERGVLELEVPERRVVLDGDGSVAGIEIRARYDSHRLIEEFMITANVAAAIALEEARQPCMYRIHDEPQKERLEDLRRFLGTLGLNLARGQVIKPEHFNRVLDKAGQKGTAPVVHQAVLRAQSQAEYAPGNIGHFGLALMRYAHFTSPIRRYSDLLVHRALIRGLGLGDGGLDEVPGDFEHLGEHISMTERRAAAAERDTVDRFTAAYLAERVGTTMQGRIAGVTRAGLFVTLDDSGGDGLAPMRALPRDFYEVDEAGHRLVGRETGRQFRLGDAIEVILAEADAVSGGLIVHVAGNGTPANGGRRSRGIHGRHRRKAKMGGD